MAKEDRLGFIKDFFDFIVALVNNKKLLLILVKNDFKSRYVKDYFGAVWAFVHPVITILVLWVVFQLGFRSQPFGDYPFILFLSSGLIPWFFLSDSITNGTNSIRTQDFLVKKVVFRVSLLPIVQITSALLVHLFFILFLVLIFMLYGFMPNLYYLQIAYYLFYSIILLLGMSWLSSSIVIFFPDLSQFINILLSLLIWLTPILWNFEIVPHKYKIYFMLNPFFYIIQGYRESLITQTWFWDKIGWGIYYWCFGFFVFLLGAVVFRRLRPHFADVL